ncbi:hypothetical protein PspLS_06014 [Pyricularia sp. CBS 133598]|nr:hypothetical protein PspLS_06014 [Pyricularia sp. CBS 133598]
MLTDTKCRPAPAIWLDGAEGETSSRSLRNSKAEGSMALLESVRVRLGNMDKSQTNIKKGLPRIWSTVPQLWRDFRVYSCMHRLRASKTLSMQKVGKQGQNPGQLTSQVQKIPSKRGEGV